MPGVVRWVTVAVWLGVGVAVAGSPVEVGGADRLIWPVLVGMGVERVAKGGRKVGTASVAVAELPTPGKLQARSAKAKTKTTEKIEKNNFA